MNIMRMLCQTKSPNFLLHFCYCFASRMRKKNGQLRLAERHHQIHLPLALKDEALLLVRLSRFEE